MKEIKNALEALRDMGKLIYFLLSKKYLNFIHFPIMIF